MEITVNGEKKELESEMTISEFLNILKIKRQALAIELNKSIIKKSEYDSAIIKDGDVIEIVQFVGGG